MSSRPLSDLRRAIHHLVRLVPGAAVVLMALLVVLPAAPADASGPSSSGPYQVVAQASSQNANLVRTETAVAAGPAAIDRFEVVRLTRTGDPRGPVLLFLPPLGTSFDFYEQRDPNGARGTSIAEFFALRGYDVWGYSPRFTGLPAGGCEAGVFDCSPMADWNLASLVDDVAFVRSLIEAERPGAPVVTGGQSLGSILGLAVVDDAPADYDGLIAWEGLLSTGDPTVEALNQVYCAGLEAQLAAGLLYEGFGNNLVQRVAAATGRAPDGLTQVPLFPPFLTNLGALVGFLSVPNPGPFTQPAPGYILFAGDPTVPEFTFASVERVVESLARFNDYVPLATVRDISCSLAGTETAYVDGLGAFTGPVIAIAGGRAFGPYYPGQLAQLGSTDVTLLVEPAFGHVDHFGVPDHRRYVERPILRWLRARF